MQVQKLVLSAILAGLACSLSVIGPEHVLVRRSLKSGRQLFARGDRGGTPSPGQSAVTLRQGAAKIYLGEDMKTHAAHAQRSAREHPANADPKPLNQDSAQQKAKERAQIVGREPPPGPGMAIDHLPLQSQAVAGGTQARLDTSTQAAVPRVESNRQGGHSATASRWARQYEMETGVPGTVQQVDNRGRQARGTTRDRSRSRSPSPQRHTLRDGKRYAA